MYCFASLFSGGGFGDLGFRKAGLEPLLLADIDPKRTQLAKLNFPSASIHTLDISTGIDLLEASIRSELERRDEDRLFLLSATPPCQGMSKNGIGTLLKSVQRGIRPPRDRRNELYMPALELVARLKPKWFFFENVCRFMNAYGIDGESLSVPLHQIVLRWLAEMGYQGSFVQVQMADYGVPQTRLRTVGVFRYGEKQSADDMSVYLPPVTHSEKGSPKLKKWVTLREAIDHLPPLDAKKKSSAQSDYHPLHRVPLWRQELYRWLDATPEGASALDNDICPSCNHHNRSQDIVCSTCGTDLPKPTVSRDGVLHLIKGFPSAYKRMFWDKPASTVTTRSAYACSDHKVHPVQNRVLSELEVLIVQSIAGYDYRWTSSNGNASKEDYPNQTVIRDVIGECVPPVFTEAVGRYIIDIEAGRSKPIKEACQMTLL